jgi:tetratricopeptide (TPR) repeat protein
MMFRSRVLLLIAALACASNAHAFNFVPRDAEWASWPPHCKARYSVSPAATGTPFYGAVSPAEVQQWQARLTDKVWEHMHHYCAGLAWMQRAQVATSSQARKSALHAAAREVSYTQRHLQPGQPLFPEVTVAAARVSAESGNLQQGINTLERAIAAQPTTADFYVALYTIQKRADRLEPAVAALQRGDAATAGKSAEIQYFLGIEAFDRGQKTEAVAFAKRAYELGYPLPGLRRKLQAEGYSLN